MVPETLQKRKGKKYMQRTKTKFTSIANASKINGAKAKSCDAEWTRPITYWASAELDELLKLDELHKHYILDDLMIKILNWAITFFLNQ
jgi:hypothetical protein